MLLKNNISRAEQQIEIAMEEILNDLEKKIPVKVKNIRIQKQCDDEGIYYKVKLLTSLK